MEPNTLVKSNTPMRPQWPKHVETHSGHVFGVLSVVVHFWLICRIQHSYLTISQKLQEERFCFWQHTSESV